MILLSLGATGSTNTVCLATDDEHNIRNEDDNNDDDIEVVERISGSGGG